MEHKSEQLLSKCTAISVDSRITVLVSVGCLIKVSIKQLLISASGETSIVDELSSILHCCFSINPTIWCIRTISSTQNTPKTPKINRNSKKQNRNSTVLLSKSELVIALFINVESFALNLLTFAAGDFNCIRNSFDPLSTVTLWIKSICSQIKFIIERCRTILFYFMVS